MKNEQDNYDKIETCIACPECGYRLIRIGDGMCIECKKIEGTSQ